jgi:hypothetical protein
MLSRKIGMGEGELKMQNAKIKKNNCIKQKLV